MTTYNVTKDYTPSIITPTITLASLASSATAGRISNAVDWTSQNTKDAEIEVTLAVGSGTIANDRCTYIWLCQSIDGSTYEDGATAGDGAYTPVNPSNMFYLGSISMPVQSATYRKVFHVSDLPPYFAVVVRNYSGIALASGSVRIKPIGEKISNA